ncbi:MAG: type II 3-dehydroquinate dehydratase [Pseudomonadales bacterium]
MQTLLVLNGPNLNLLGKREPAVYGATSLAEIEGHLRQLCDAQGIGLSFVQSNAEHELLEQIHAALDSDICFILINPAAFTHTSVALRDALLAVGIPFIEVHLSNVHVRERFRRQSYLSDIARGVISGLGPGGYSRAAAVAIAHMKNAK